MKRWKKLHKQFGCAMHGSLKNFIRNTTHGNMVDWNLKTTPKVAKIRGE